MAFIVIFKHCVPKVRGGIESQRNVLQVYLVGGNSSLISDSRKQGRTCFYYDLQDDTWSRGPSLQQSRWTHGLVRLGDVLYAVGGCGQQNSMEALSLIDLESGWAPRPPMNARRYVPGVAVLNGLIYVVGGADSQWSAQRTVECFHPGALFYYFYSLLCTLHMFKNQSKVSCYNNISKVS